ncbi:PilZ domain-containing protein [bacterium]|nr:PilZ domain-containing protein [bacterium]
MIKLVKSDSRNYPRIKLQKNVQGKILIGPETELAKIIDRSLGGFSMLAKPELLKKVRLYQNELMLEYHDQVFKTAIKNYRNDKGGYIYGLQLVDFSEEKSLSFKDNEADWDLVENAETIQNIFSDLAFKAASALVNAKQVSGQSVLIPHQYNQDEHSMTFEFLENSYGQMSPGKSNFSFHLFQTYHSFEGQILQMDDSMVKVKLPKSIARMLRRETERILPKQFKVGLQVEINTPFFAQAYKGEIYDISEHGLSILDADNGELFLPIGYKIQNVQLKLENGDVIEGHAEVRGSKWIEDKQCYAVGFRFKPIDDANTTKWHNFILESRYPQMTFDYQSKSDHKKIWDLFARSGHLNINKNNKTYTHILNLTKRTWEKLSKTGTKWSKRAMIKKEGQIVGHIQMDRIYQDTWCIHHLSIDPKVSKLVARDIYALTTDVLLAEGGEFLVSFTEANKPWNQRSYYDFVEDYRYKDHNELKHYTTVEVSTGIGQEKNNDIICRIANSYDQKRIIRFIEIYISELEKRACCLNSENLKLEKTAKIWRKNDLLRGREFVVAYKKNQLVGLSALEYGESGLNIVGVLNMLYVFNLDFAQEEYKIEAVDAMLQEAAVFYKSTGRKKFLVNLEKGLDIEELKTENSFLAEAVRWIAKKDILPRYRSFSHLLYGHIILNKEKIRKRISDKKKVKRTD